LKIAQLCAICAQLCATEQLMLTIKFFENCTALCDLCTALCEYHLVGDFYTSLNKCLRSPLVILVCRMTSRRTEIAAENPKNKRKFVNKYFCYRILESGEGSAADTLQFSPTPSPPTLH
jgi:hypothetical protein